MNGLSKFDSWFWISYAIITFTFIIQLICSFFIFNEKKLQNRFYNIPVYSASILCLAAMLLTGGLCMWIIPVPSWIGGIACCFLLVVYVIVLSALSAAANTIKAIDKKVKVKTLFVKMLTANAEALMQNTTDPEMQPIAKKIYEAVRYSDPMSSKALEGIEYKISAQFDVLSAALKNGDVAVAQAEAAELECLINERNTKCKILK